MFSLSYAITTVRSILIYFMYTYSDPNFSSAIFNELCSSQEALTLLNFVSFTISELIPYVTIFILNWRNFRQIRRQNEFLKKREDKLTTRIKTYNSE